MLQVRKRVDFQYDTFSALSCRKVCRFLNTLEIGQISDSTVNRLARFLDFPKRQPIPLGQVQMIYLLIILAKLRGNTYEFIVDNFLTKANQTHLDDYWLDISHHGNLTKSKFDQLLVDFYKKS